MSLLAPTLQLFFAERLIKQRQASPRTITSYRDTFRLFLQFAQRQTGKAPCALGWEDLSAKLISAFLDHLEADRHNSARSRNTRLAALHSLFRYASYAELGISRIMPSRKLCRVGRRPIQRLCLKQAITMASYSA